MLVFDIPLQLLSPAHIIVSLCYAVFLLAFLWVEIILRKLIQLRCVKTGSTFNRPLAHLGPILYAGSIQFSCILRETDIISR